MKSIVEQQPIPYLRVKMTPKKKSLFVLLQSYSLLLILGGIFAHTHSLLAIIPSVLSGVIIQIGAWLVLREKKWALPFNFFSVLGLVLFFIYRWFLIRKFYPPVLLAMVSLFLVFKISQALIERKKSKNTLFS